MSDVTEHVKGKDNKISSFGVQTFSDLNTRLVLKLYEEFPKIQKISMACAGEEAPIMISCCFTRNDRPKLATAQNRIQQLHTSLNHILHRWEDGELVKKHLNLSGEEGHIYVSYTSKDEVLTLESANGSPVVIIKGVKANEEQPQPRSQQPAEKPAENPKKLTLNQELAILKEQSIKRTTEFWAVKDAQRKVAEENYAKEKAKEKADEEAVKKKAEEDAMLASQLKEPEVKRKDPSTFFCEKAKRKFEEYKGCNDYDTACKKLITDLQCQLDKEYKLAAIQVLDEEVENMPS